jgi:Tfp pilus assembly protein FimT
MTNATRDNTVVTAGGFSLAEVLIMVLVMGITATVVIPILSTSDHSIVTGGARRMASDIQYAQDTAIATQKDITITFDLNRETYWLSNESGVLIHPISSNAYAIDFTVDKELSQLDIAEVSRGGSAVVSGVYSITFDPGGVPDTGGTVVLRAGDSRFGVTVSSITGTVTVAVNE